MIVIINHTITNCGVYQYGKRLAKILSQSGKFTYHEISCVEQYQAICLQQPELFIYNYHPATAPWLTNATIQKRVPNVGIFHESHMNVYFDYIIDIDPTAKDTMTQISIPRPLLSIPHSTEITSVEPELITIGSFGFGFQNKGWDKIVKLVNEQYDQALIRLNIPFAHFADRDPVTTACQIETLCSQNNVKAGVQLIITHKFMDDEELLEFLGSNTINIFMYDPMPGRGCSSTIDYALAVGRPIGISDSNMFRHIYSDDICVYKRSIADIIGDGTVHCDRFRTMWADHNLIQKVDHFLTTKVLTAIPIKNNTILNDRARHQLRPVIDELFQLVPIMMARKIVRANVQQAFVFKYLRDHFTITTSILCVGSYEDTCCSALRQLNYNVVEIDPRINYDLHTYCVLTSYAQVSVIFSISTINHIQDDELFLDDICKLLNPGGTAILLCDFNNDYQPGTHKPSCDYRLYTKTDLLVRFRPILERNNCTIQGEIDYEGAPDFLYENALYTFGTLIFQKVE